MDSAHRNFRDNGAVGALLDEYEKAIIELKLIIQDVSSIDLLRIVDTKTTDPDCVSIQSILTHVVGAGFNYVVAIRKHLGEELNYKPKENLTSVGEYQLSLDLMFAFNEQLFKDYPSLNIEEFSDEKKINVTWGQQYDVEQLFEHAIVHILRHRRQIERFKMSLTKA